MFVCPECGATGQGFCPADGQQMLPIGDDLLLGTTVGAYRIARLLGVGGMGRVYKGVHPTIGSRVAVKVLSRECSDRRDLVERFFAEAKAVNLIRHESIVNVLDLAVLPDGRPYIIMEYLDGQPLANLIARPLPLGGLARLAVEALDALNAAHAKGIVHRDLKPDNIFVTPAGRPKILDFGIAKLTDATLNSATRTGSLLGTPHYMSPEQAAGRAVDHRADIYAMGVILFECSTARRPFSAESLFDLLKQHVEAPPPHPRQFRADMPVAMEQVILTALAKAPEQRFASAQAMSLALQQATAQLPQAQWVPISGVATSSGGWSPSAPPSWAATNKTAATTVDAPKKSRRGLWLAMLALVLIGGGITAGVVAANSGDDEPTAKPAAPPPVVAKKDEPKAVEPPPAKTVEKPVPAPVEQQAAEDGEAEAQMALDEAAKELEAAGVDDAQIQKLKAINKLPMAERMKALEALGNEINGAMGGAPPPKPVKPKPAKNGWTTTHPLDYPNYDPKHVDIAKFIAFALEAAKEVPDAKLMRFGTEGLFPDGHADLSLPGFAANHGDIELRFMSPSHAKTDPNLPLGVKQEKTCEFRVEADMEGVQLRVINGMGCDEKPIAPPRCTPQQVWEKIYAKRPDLRGKNAVARLSFYDFGRKGGEWSFTIENVVSEVVPDCN